MKAIFTRDLSKTYWFHEKEPGLTGSIRSLFRARKVFVEAVRGIDLEVGIGEAVGFIGPNGAGKTTTLKMFSGILIPNSGELEVMGHVPFRREKPFLKNISLLSGQRNRLFWDLPAAEYFNFCKLIYEIPEPDFQKNLRLLVELARIGDILKVPQRKLSFGQRKRCELVAALLHDPRVIFLDEPTNAMDLVSAQSIREFIREKGKQGSHTIILTSHIVSDIEQVCDRVVIINQGKIAFDGSMRGLHASGGFKKRVRIFFSTFPDRDVLEKLGHIADVNGQEVTIEVEPDRTAAVASYLLAHHPVQDLSILDPPLEKVIQSIYQGEDSGSGDTEI